MTRAKPKPAPHVHVVDQDVPADPLDTTGRRVYAVCHLIGRPGDGRHAMPEPVPDVARLAAGEGGER